MAEYIDREAVYADACQGCVRHGDELGSCYAEEPCYKLICVFANAHTADVAPVVRGRWELHKDGSGTCKRCHTKQKAVWDIDRWQNYCGHCGARMEESENK